MVRVTEGNRLLTRLRSPRGVRRRIQLGKRPRKKTQDEDRAEYSDARECVRAVMKNLGHELALSRRYFVSVLGSHQ
jgi:hypothetical protein